MANKKRSPRKKPVPRGKPGARRKPVARKQPVASKKARVARKKLKPPKRPPHKKLPRKPPKTRPPQKHRRPLEYWLRNHPRIAAAIKWQFRAADLTNAYTPPAESDKAAWDDWTAQQKADLSDAYLACRVWFAAGAPQAAMGAPGLTDAPTNFYTGNDSNTVSQQVSPEYMWKLYVAHVAIALAAETEGVLPWSIATYGGLALRYLFDSSTMAWNLYTGVFAMGTYAVFVPALRADNLPETAFAPPKWTYPFLAQAGLIGYSRLDTVARVLEWMRQNMAHYNGIDNLGTCDAIWQYRGYPPLSRIIGGTVDARTPGLGTRHWTLGCHGSVGFLNAVLRVLNIPVQPVWVSGHELAYFITEGKYLDHGDDPYNLIVRNSTAPILDVLIDEATYQTRFTNDLTVNIVDLNSPAAANIAYSAVHFPP